MKGAVGPMAAGGEGRCKVSRGIVESIMGMMTTGALKVGDRLPAERVLTEQLGVSRASLREALAALEIIGVIEVRHGEGSFVSDLNVTHFLNTISPLFLKVDKMEEDLLDFRRLLECEAVRLVMEKPVRDTAGLRRCLADMRRALDHGDIEANVGADVAFHREIVEMSDNYILKQALACVRYMMAQSVRFNVSKIMQQNDNGEILYLQHMQIAQKIENGTVQEALDLLTEHLDFVKKL